MIKFKLNWFIVFLNFILCSQVFANEEWNRLALQDINTLLPKFVPLANGEVPPPSCLNRCFKRYHLAPLDPSTNSPYFWFGQKHKRKLLKLDYFQIASVPVTRILYFKVVKKNPDIFSARNDKQVQEISETWEDCPRCAVTFVSMKDAVEFIIQLNSITGKNFDLPTKYELEYSLRGRNPNGTIKDGLYDFGDDMRKLSEYAWHEGNSKGIVQPIDSKLPNSFGIHVLGNIWKWSKNQNDNQPSRQICKGGSCTSKASIGFFESSFELVARDFLPADDIGIQLVLRENAVE